MISVTVIQRALRQNNEWFQGFTWRRGAPTFPKCNYFGRSPAASEAQERNSRTVRTTYSFSLNSRRWFKVFAMFFLVFLFFKIPYFRRIKPYLSVYIAVYWLL